ncbi:MAG: hypothetical protein ACQZ2J_27690 [Pseudomonas piscis]|uniref:hypothetical protein n=1 Tax=Pseudomonas piscis TaxID=2614538 RepID=UPI003D2E2F58
MGELNFDIKDPRNLIYKYGEFDVLIMFAWEEGIGVPRGARVNVTRKEPFSYAQMDQINIDWNSFDDAVHRLRSYAKLFADGMPYKRPA